MQHDQPRTRYSVLDRLIRLSLSRRGFVLGAAAALFAIGGYFSDRLAVDVFPDLNKPVVTVLAEAHGLAAAEVETLVTIPLESALLGAPGVTGVRTSSKRGIAMLRVEFDWGADIYRCRQTVSERLSAARADVPDDVRAALGPISSIMGEILLIGLTAEDETMSLREVRTFADWTVRRRLLAVPGVSNVTVMGGDARAYEIAVSAERLAARNIGFLDVKETLAGVGGNTGGGFFERDGQEFVYRNLGSIYDLDEIGQAFAGYLAGIPVRVGDVAVVYESQLPRRGDAGVDAERGVIVAVQKQPGAATLDLTKRITKKLDELQQGAGAGIRIHGELFRQADFIERAVENVMEAVRDGSIIVAIVLILFLWNLRTTAITLLALPLSLIGGVLALSALGFGINTMTLGGLAVAVGELVDDAVVDVENCFRRLRENRQLPEPRPAFEVVFEASSEIRNSIVLATGIVILVFVPLFFLGGVEGRLFQPLAVAYILAILASLGVALTITPVLCFYLLPNYRFRERESWIVRTLKTIQERNLLRIIDRPRVPLIGALVCFGIALACLPFLGRAFLPSFNEGTLTVEVISAPGTALSESVESARKLEAILKGTPGVVRIARRTGRAEMDEHAEGVHYSEFDVGLDPAYMGERRRRLIADLREKFAGLEGVAVGIGQPISHRLDHLMSGIRSEVAVMIYGRDFDQLQYAAYQTQAILKEIPGVTDLRAEQASLAPEYKIVVKHADAGRYGLPVPELVEGLEAAQGGAILGRVLDGDRFVPVLLRLDERSRAPDALARFTLRHLPDGTPIRLGNVADLYESEGPYEIQREDGERRIAVQLNSDGRGLADLVAEIDNKLAAGLSLPEGMRFELAGRYESAIAAARRMAWLSLAALIGISAMLYANFRSALLTVQILLNLPFALIGGVFALLVTGTPLSVASLVGFVALAGIAARNGILMISHFEHLMRVEGESFSESTVVRGALERLTPVLMTAGTAILALTPVLWSGPDAPGKELLFPVALVITGGLCTSTLLDLMITPVIYYHLARRYQLFPAEADS